MHAREQGPQNQLDERARAFYLRVLTALDEAGIPFLVGGAYALSTYTGIERHTKDFDIFVRREHYDSVMSVLAGSGCETDLTFPHWLGKARCAHGLVDVIFSSGNGVALVDDEWFANAPAAEALGFPVKVCPAEEMIWSKAYVNERERYDGADVMHLLLACAEKLDWRRLLSRFDVHWRILFGYLCLFGFVYPSERGRIPAWIMSTLVERLVEDLRTPAPAERVCQGTLLSREQYLVDVERWGFRDARLDLPNMTPEDIAHWTRAIELIP